MANLIEIPGQKQEPEVDPNLQSINVAYHTEKGTFAIHTSPTLQGKPVVTVGLLEMAKTLFLNGAAGAPPKPGPIVGGG